MRPRLLHLTWHGLGEPHSWLDAAARTYWVAPASFARTLDILPEIERSSAFEARVTFDDGNASDILHAVPALVARKRRATFFVCAGRIGSPGYLTAAQIREMAAAGMTIGSHGWDHVDWRVAPDNVLRHELVDSRHALSDLIGKTIDGASVPFGAVDRRVVQAASLAGFTRLFASSGGLTTATTGLIPRTSVKADFEPEHHLSLWTSQMARIQAGLRDPVRRMKYGFY